MQRYKNGLGTLEDLDSARSAVASSKATIEENKETLAQQQRVLNTLLGRTQQLSFDIAATYPEAKRIDINLVNKYQEVNYGFHGFGPFAGRKGEQYCVNAVQLQPSLKRYGHQRLPGRSRSAPGPRFVEWVRIASRDARLSP